MANSKSNSAKVNAESIEVEDVVDKKEINVDSAKSNSSKSIVPKDVDPAQYVVVKNGFQGTLIYKSKHTGEVYVWEGFGTEQEMELRELKRAKNTSRQFFVDNLFMFEEDWIVDYLGVRQFYNNALTIDEFDDLFTKKAKDIETIIEGLSAGQKRSVIYRASQLIANGEIDSRSVISTLEKCLGVELIEK